MNLAALVIITLLGAGLGGGFKRRVCAHETDLVEYPRFQQ